MKFHNIVINLFLDALLTQTLLILSLEVGINLSTLGGSVAVHLSLNIKNNISHNSRSHDQTCQSSPA